MLGAGDVDVHLELLPQLGVTGEGTQATVEVDTALEQPLRLPLPVHGGPLGKQGRAGPRRLPAELGARAEEPVLETRAVLHLLLHEADVEVAQRVTVGVFDDDVGVTLDTEHVLGHVLDHGPRGSLCHAVHLVLDLGPDVEIRPRVLLKVPHSGHFLIPRIVGFPRLETEVWLGVSEVTVTRPPPGPE